MALQLPSTCLPVISSRIYYKGTPALAANDSLERDVAELLIRPVGRPSHKPVVRYKGFLYQAASWKKARRVVAKVEFHAGELFPRVGFIVTNLEADSPAVVRFYNKRGTAERWIKEGKQAVKMTRLSCHRFRSNEVRSWLSVIAYNLGHLWRGVPSGPGAAAARRQLVAHEPATTIREDGRAADQACSLLLALAGGGASDAATLRGHGAADRGVAGAYRIGRRGTEASQAKGGGGPERCMRNRLK